MGEIRVKSENLFDVTTVTNAYLDVLGVEHSSEVSKTSDYIPVTANTLYTLGMTGSSSSLNLTAYCFYDSNKEFLSSDTYQPSTIGNIVSITTPNNCAYFRFTYNQQRILVEFVSGVYNTFPPYFLSLPAHQKTADGWKDIPTHIMTATGWQGELTSQSPLEFRATGQSLLDWRIDGASGGVGDWDETEQKYVIPVNVRSKNLFDFGFVVAGTMDVVKFPISLGEPRKTWFGDVERGKTYKFTLTNNNRCIIVGYNQHHSQTEMEAYTPSNPLPSDVEIYWNNASIDTTITITIPNNVVMIGVYYATGSAPTATLEVYYDTTTNLYTDHQLMDGDSLEFATDQTTIPITQGDNTLTVETAVQPNKVYVKFEG